MYHRAKQLSKILACVVLTGCILAACARLFATPIEKILDNPREYSGKTVAISGEVTEVAGFIFVKYFVVKDRTGEITVITTRPLPREHANITVKGKVETAFTLGTEQLIVIIENEEK